MLENGSCVRRRVEGYGAKEIARNAKQRFADSRADVKRECHPCGGCPEHCRGGQPQQRGIDFSGPARGSGGPVCGVRSFRCRRPRAVNPGVDFTAEFTAAFPPFPSFPAPSSGTGNRGQVRASILHDLGVPAKVVQQQLGHATVETTLNIYTHAIPETHRRAVENLERVLFPSVPNLADQGKESGFVIH